MRTPDQVRVRETLDGLTSSAVPAPPFAALIAREPVRTGGRLPLGLVSAAAAAVVIAVVAVLVNADDRGAETTACADALRIGDLLYELDPASGGRLTADDLGEVVGRVDRELPCEAVAPDLRPGEIAALVVPVGGEVRALPTVETSSAVAAIVDGDVQVFRVRSGDPLEFPAGITAIGVSSAADGRIRFATIDDPDLLDELVAAARNGSVTGEPVPTTGTNYVIHLERDDGLVDVVSFHPEIGRLGGRTVDARWRDAIDAALDDAPGPPAVAGLTLQGESGTARFHPPGSCRHDAPDLVVRPGEVVTVTVDADQVDADREVFWTLNPPVPAAGVTEAQFTTGNELTLPDFAGAMIVEVSVVAAGGADAVDACTTLATG